MRRNFRRHANRNSIRPVHQQVRVPGRQHRRLCLRAVVVRIKIDRFFIQIFQQRRRNPRQPRFRVTIRRRRIAIHRPKIPLPIHQRSPHRKRLRQSHQRVIHRQVSMRMVFAHHFADDTSALARRPPRSQPHLLHRVQNPPMHRLQPVAHVRQRAADNHRQRIVEIRPLHLLFNVDGLHVERARPRRPVAARRRS